MPGNTEKSDMIDFLIEKTKNVKSPMVISQLVKEYKETSGAAEKEICLRTRINNFRETIHKHEPIATATKVKLMFGLSASLNPDFLKELQNDAFVEVDERNRITKYKANGGEMELEGDHCHISVYQQLIRNYFNTKNRGDDDTNNRCQKEITCLIDFVTVKCENVETPLSLSKLITDFKRSFRTSTSTAKLLNRIKTYRQEIQKIEQLDTHSKVKQLFGLSATLSPDLLKELQRDAQVEVDGQNRIIRYAVIPKQEEEDDIGMIEYPEVKEEEEELLVPKEEQIIKTEQVDVKMEFQ